MTLLLFGRVVHCFTHPLAPSLGGRGVLAARHRWVPHSLSPSVPSDLTSPTPPHTIVHPRSDDDIFIHCSGGLTLFPVTDPSKQPSRIDDAYLELLGRPVRLHDAAEQVSAECAQLRYEALAKRVELIGSQTYPLRLEAQQLLAGGERFWLRQTDYVSGFEGPGWITAREPAHLETAGAERPLRVDWQENVELHFDEPDETGWPRHLRRALFRGDVAAADDQRTVWSDALGVTFSDREASGTTGDDELQVESLTAEGNVQVLLSNGARAFAEKMTGEAAASTIELSGPNTTIAYDTMLIDNGTFVTFDEATQIARWEGPGRARFYPEPIETALAQRIERPHLAVEPQMRATWSGLMLLDGQANDGAGSLDLEGNVEATSRPSPLERRWLKAEMVHLDFGPDPDAPRKNLRRLIAVGNARMESRTWLTERHLDTPRLFHVAGPRIEYDADTAEVHVIGAGELLVRDLREIADDEDATAFSGKGTTLFRWKGDLHMTEAGEDLFDVEMRDDVEVLHSGPDNQTLTMRCQHLVATIERSGAGGAGGAGGEPGDFGLDGPAKLRRLRATGAVFVRTDTRDVDCHEFTYDTETQLTEATALPGRKVSVLTRGSAQRFRAEHMLWNMKLDTVRFKAISGGSNR